MKVYLQVVAGIADAEVLPFDWRAIAMEFSKTITGYQKEAGKAFDLSPSADASASLLATLEGFHAAIAKGKVKPAAANRAIEKLARILVPINYSRMPRFRHDPALPVPPLPTLSAASELKGLDKVKLGFAKTQLVRGQNRFIAACREAEAVAGERWTWPFQQLKKPCSTKSRSQHHGTWSKPSRQCRAGCRRMSTRGPTKSARG
jgi:hypothetical protein